MIAIITNTRLRLASYKALQEQLRKNDNYDDDDDADDDDDDNDDDDEYLSALPL